MEKNEAKEAKVNRYTILDAEVKRVSKELKDAKKAMLQKIKDAEAEYRKYRKDVYAPARKAAFDKFKASKIVGVKPKTEKVKKVVQKKVTGTDKTAAECIEAGEKAIANAKLKCAAAMNPKAK